MNEMKQCSFRVLDELEDENLDTAEIYYGILVIEQGVICGCCGGFFPLDEVEIVEIFNWKDLTSILEKITIDN